MQKMFDDMDTIKEKGSSPQSVPKVVTVAASPTIAGTSGMVRARSLRPGLRRKPTMARGT